MTESRTLLALSLTVAFYLIATTEVKADSSRGNTRPKSPAVGNEGNQENPSVQAGNEGSPGIAALDVRSRPKRSMETDWQKRSNEADELERLANEILEKVKLANAKRLSQEARASAANEHTNLDPQETAALVLRLWQAFCDQDGMGFDRRSASCVTVNNNMDKKAWGNPGHLPG